MATDFISREETPLSAEVWEKIDDIVVGAASSQLAGRRILNIEGPYGLGFKAIPGSDRPTGEALEMDGATADILTSPMIPLAAIQATFRIPIRDVAAFEQSGIDFIANEAVAAALAVARQEDTLIFYGSKALGVEGLTTLKTAESYRLSPWDEPGKSVDDVIAAVSVLDEAGFPGPYAMALAPVRYNLLFRRFMQGNLSEFDLLREVVSGGIVKAPILKDGGILIATGNQFASVALGQDLTAMFIGPEGAYYQFALIESVAVRIKYPSAICSLK